MLLRKKAYFILRGYNIQPLKLQVYSKPKKIKLVPIITNYILPKINLEHKRIAFIYQKAKSGKSK